MSAVTPETPPKRRAPQRDWAAVAAQLREHPNEWFVVATDVPTNTAARLRKRGLEARCHNVAAGRAEKLYARYATAEEQKS